MNPLDCFDDCGNFSQLKKAYYFNKKCNQELWETIDLLNQTNEQYQETHIKGQLQMKKLLDEISVDGINAQYANLKENFHNLQIQFNELNNKHEDLKASHANQLKDLEKQHNDELETLKIEYLVKCSQYEDNMAKLKEEIDAKEEEYLQDIHTTQAESAFRFDEMESNLQKLLDTSNKKIRELNQSNSVLRSEMMTIKSNFTIANSTKIQELESRLLTTENQLKIAQAKLLQNRESAAPKCTYLRMKQPDNNHSHQEDIATYVPKANKGKVQNTVNMITQNEPENNCNLLPINVINEVNEAAASVKLYKETKKTCWIRRKTYESKENLNIPPLKQLSNMPSATNCLQVKRRKLYSLGDVEHLEGPD